jgi:hypothetical protein
VAVSVVDQFAVGIDSARRPFYQAPKGPIRNNLITE